jgi:N utilization substance protein A
MKFYVKSVEMSVRGPEIILSRATSGMVKEIFKQEIPELQEGVIEIKGLAREAGFRSKVAVATSDSSIDPIGSCIGQRGSRITTIIEELGGEKIDVIQFNDNAEKYIIHALSPAKVLNVELDETARLAKVLVAPEQFSLAIGRSGQNVRLASELTGWKISVVQEGVPEESAEKAAEEVGEEKAEEVSAPEQVETAEAKEEASEE